MRFYTTQHRFYRGVDLHTRTMYLCIRDQAGAILFHKNLPASAQAFLDAVPRGPGCCLRVPVRLVLAG